jgi:polygalacturonase
MNPGFDPGSSRPNAAASPMSRARAQSARERPAMPYRQIRMQQRRFPSSYRGVGVASQVLLALAVALTMRTAAAEVHADLCSPLTYGAVGDGVTDNTSAIQSAINACAKAGGGTVRLPLVSGHGNYLTSPIALASHVRLLIDKGVTLLGSTDHTKYRAAFPSYPYRAHEALISAYRADDTGIIGPGTVDGQGGMTASDGGPSWWAITPVVGATTGGTTWYAAPHADSAVSDGAPRPWLVEFYQCTNVTVNDVTLTNAPMWNLVFRYSSHITVSEYTATITPDPLIAHTDGIDLIGSSDATLLFLNIGTGGDSVGLNAGPPPKDSIPDDPNQGVVPQLSTHDVRIANSIFTNGNGIVVGSEAENGVYNVAARNIVERNTGYGVLLKSSRSRGIHATGIYNIIAQNVTMTGVRQPLAISADEAAMGTADERPADPPQAITPGIHDITISDLTATGATAESFILGLPESCIDHVTLSNVSITGHRAALRMRNMRGTFTSVNATLQNENSPFVAQENVSVITAGAMPAIANSAPLASRATAHGLPCGRKAEY